MSSTALRAFLFALVMVAAGFAAVATGGSDPNNSNSDNDDRVWCRLTGHVSDDNGEPVAGASLYLAPDWEVLDPDEDGNMGYLWREKSWAETGDDGAYRLDALPGSYVLEVYTPNHFSYREALVIDNDATLNLTLEAMPARDATLQLAVTGPQSFSATLRDPVRDWWLDSAWGEDTVTLSGWAGELELEVYSFDEGYLIHRQTVTLTAGEETSLTLALEPYVDSATITGFALDQHGNGVAQARVTFALPDVGYRATTLTAADGSYSLAVIPGNYHQFYAAAFAHDFTAPAVETVVAVENEDTVLDLTLTAKPLDFEQAGVVVDHTGQPMADITVTAWGYLYDWYFMYDLNLPFYAGYDIFDESGYFNEPGYGDSSKSTLPYFNDERVKVAETTTDADGRFTLLLPGDESIEVEAAAEGYVTATTWVWTYQFDDNEDRCDGSQSDAYWDIKLVLYPAPDVALTGTVTLPDGTTVEGAWVSFHRDYVRPTDGDWIAGVWKYSDIEGGCWYIETEQGKRYEVVETADGVTLERAEGEKAWLLVEKVNVATVCQIGAPVRVLAVGGEDANTPGTDSDEWSYSGGWNYRYYGDSAFTSDDGGYALDLYSGSYKVDAWYYEYDDIWYVTENGEYRDAATGSGGVAGCPSDDGTLPNPSNYKPAHYRFTGEVTLAPGAQVYDITLEKVEDDAKLVGQLTLSDGSIPGDPGDGTDTRHTLYVEVTGPDYYNLTTVRNGDWEVNLPHGQTYGYRIWSDDPLVHGVRGHAEIGAKGSVTTVTDELKVTVLDSTLKGTVTLDDRPIAGATVTVWGVGIAYDDNDPERESDPNYDRDADETRDNGYDGITYAIRDSADNRPGCSGSDDGSSPSSGTAWSDDPDDAKQGCEEKPYYGLSYTRTLTTDADGKFSLPVAGGRLYSVEVSYWGDLRNAITDDYVPSLYGAFRHVYVDYDVTVELKLELEQQWRNRDRDDVWWETTDKAPRELDATGGAMGEDWRDAAAGDAIDEEFPFRLAVEWPPRDGNVPVVLTDPDGTPVAGLAIVVFRDGEEYSTVITDSEGYAEVELGETDGHEYAFEARAGDQVMAYVAMDQVEPNRELPAMGALAALALLGLVAVRRRRD